MEGAEAWWSPCVLAAEARASGDVDGDPCFFLCSHRPPPPLEACRNAVSSYLPLLPRQQPPLPLKPREEGSRPLQFRRLFLTPPLTWLEQSSRSLPVLANPITCQPQTPLQHTQIHSPVILSPVIIGGFGDHLVCAFSAHCYRTEPPLKPVTAAFTCNFPPPTPSSQFWHFSYHRYPQREYPGPAFCLVSLKVC